MSDNSGVQKLKRRRISRACDYCHGRGIRCQPSGDNGTCKNCATFGQPCTFDRPMKRRGAQKQTVAAASSHETYNESKEPSTAVRPGQDFTQHRDGTNNIGVLSILTAPPARTLESDTRRRAHDRSTESRNTLRPENTSVSVTQEQRSGDEAVWHAPSVASQATVMDLVELYFEIVYPIFPLFHQPSFLRRISRAEHCWDRTLFAVTMAVCALVSARIRDGAVFSPRWNVASLSTVRPEVYYAEARRQTKATCEFAVEIGRVNLDVLRAHAILALTAIQDGKIREMHIYLGQYHTLMAMDGLHDEANWPRGLGVVEIEERRRTFWSIYTLDIFTSIVWGGVMRCRECQTNIRFPAEADDDIFDHTGFAGIGSSPKLPGSTGSLTNTSQMDSAVSWVAGRNFVIDLYRVIEHVVTRSAPHKSANYRKLLLHELLQEQDPTSSLWTHDRLSQIYAELPRCFREITPVTFRPQLDRFGFQAADIVASMQLLRMVLLSASGGSVAERCRVANEVVNAFITIPTAYQQAISVPLLFHISVIGQILSSALEQPLALTEYVSIRDVLVAMTQLLLKLEGLHAYKGASQRLSEQVSKIDIYMSAQRQQHNTAQSVDHATGADDTPLDYSAYTSTMDDSLAGSAFQLPSEMLGEFASVFDFVQMSHNWTDG